MCVLTSSNCYQIKRDKEHKYSLPLGEENPHKFLLIEIPLTNIKTMTLDAIFLSNTKTSILFHEHYWDHHLSSPLTPLHHQELHHCSNIIEGIITTPWLPFKTITKIISTPMKIMTAHYFRMRSLWDHDPWHWSLPKLTLLDLVITAYFTSYDPCLHDYPWDTYSYREH